MTLGLSFIIADLCLLIGPAIRCRCRHRRNSGRRCAISGFPTYRLVVLGLALVAAVGLYFLMERTRIGAMIRAGVDDMEMARGVGIPVGRLFTMVFMLGAALAGTGGVWEAHPQCLSGPRCRHAAAGADRGDPWRRRLRCWAPLSAASCRLLYNFGIALAPDLAYFVLFLPMVLVLVFLPQGLFGRVQL